MSAFDDLLRAGFREQKQQMPCTATVGGVTKTGTRTPWEINEEVRISGKRYNIDAAIDLEDADFASLAINEGDELTVDGRTVRLVRLSKDSGFTQLIVGAPR